MPNEIATRKPSFTPAQVRGMCDIARQGYIDGRRCGGAIKRMQWRLSDAKLIERNPKYGYHGDGRPWQLTDAGRAALAKASP